MSHIGNIFLKNMIKVDYGDSVHYITRSINPDYFILISESEDVDCQYMTQQELIDCFPILDKKLERL